MCTVVAEVNSAGVVIAAIVGVVNVLVLKVGENLIGNRRYISKRQPQQNGKKDRANPVGAQKAVERNAAGEDGDNFCTAGQLAGKENDRNENEQRKKQRNHPRHKTEMILLDDFPGAEAAFYKIVGVLTGVYHNGDKSEKQNGKHKSGNVLPQYVPIEFGQRWRFYRAAICSIICNEQAAVVCRPLF